MSSLHLVRLAAVSAGLLGGVLVHRWTQDPGAMHVVRSAADRKEIEPCGGGGDVNVSFTPRATRSTTAGDTMRIGVSVTTRWSLPATVAYEYYLTDAQARELHRDAYNTPAPVPAAATWDREFDLPAGLPDGYYRVHLLVVAAATADVNETHSRDLFFRVAHGSYLPMDMEDWHASSSYLAALP